MIKQIVIEYKFEIDFEYVFPVIFSHSNISISDNGKEHKEIECRIDMTKEALHNLSNMYTKKSNYKPELELTNKKCFSRQTNSE